MTREEAMAVLGVADAGQASAAFRRLSVRCHPDGQTPDPVLWANISEAKRVLLAPVKCATCKGAGRVITRIAKVCALCGGTGWLS